MTLAAPAIEEDTARPAITATTHVKLLRCTMFTVPPVSSDDSARTESGGAPIAPPDPFLYGFSLLTRVLQLAKIVRVPLHENAVVANSTKLHSPWAMYWPAR